MKINVLYDKKEKFHTIKIVWNKSFKRKIYVSNNILGN